MSDLREAAAKIRAIEAGDIHPSIRAGIVETIESVAGLLDRCATSEEAKDAEIARLAAQVGVLRDTFNEWECMFCGRCLNEEDDSVMSCEHCDPARKALSLSGPSALAAVRAAVDAAKAVLTVLSGGKGGGA